jgi:hypothetical protein
MRFQAKRGKSVTAIFGMLASRERLGTPSRSRAGPRTRGGREKREDQVALAAATRFDLGSRPDHTVDGFS